MSRVQPGKPVGLQQALTRYADAAAVLPDTRIDAVRVFQRDRIHARHGQHPILDFFTDNLAEGIDLGGLEEAPEDSARRIHRLLGNVKAAAASIEFAALSVELDHALALELGDTPLNISRYVEAYRAVGRKDDRERQLALVAFVTDDLASVPDSKIAYTAFKLAKRPARAAGFGAFYDLLAAGFDALRNDQQAEQRIGEWLAEEQALVNRLLD